MEGKTFIGLQSHKQYVNVYFHSHQDTTAQSYRSIYSCSSNGSLRLRKLDISDNPTAESAEHKTRLPTRLRAWDLMSDGSHFAYGGQEVELSVWDSKRAFERDDAAGKLQMTSGKRKRDLELLPGEVWRAKRVSIPIITKVNS